VIVPAEGETFGIHRFAQLRELLAKGAPLRFAAVAFANERCRRKNRLDAQVLADFRYRPGVGTQTIHADMTAWSHHPVVVEHPFSGGRDRRGGRQTARRICTGALRAARIASQAAPARARGVELKGKTVDWLHKFHVRGRPAAMLNFPNVPR
jgi:hypothetical protein